MSAGADLWLVLTLVAEGLSNRAIAERLFVTERTVEAHVTQIFLSSGSEPTRARTAGCSRCSRTSGHPRPGEAVAMRADS